MKILVTGSSGYIGNHLVNILKAANYNVYGQDIADPYIEPNQFLKHDIRKGTYTNEHFDCVIHLAALVKVGESQQDPLAYYSTNINGTVNLLKHVRTNNFIFASTGVAEKCNNPYGVSKRAAEDCVRQFCETLDIPFTTFRFYNVIGSTVAPATNPDGLFYNLIRTREQGTFRIYGTDYNTPDGTAIRDYVHVEEICHAIVAAIEKPANGVENLGHGRGYSVREITELFKVVNNYDFKIIEEGRRQGDLETSVLDNPSKYMPKLYSIEEMLKVK